jgi:hypothetical protein
MLCGMGGAGSRPGGEARGAGGRTRSTAGLQGPAHMMMMKKLRLLDVVVKDG